MLKFIISFILILFISYNCFGEVKEVSIKGTIELDFIWRNNFFDYDNDKRNQSAYGELEVNLEIKAWLSDNIFAKIEIEEGDKSKTSDSDNIPTEIDEAWFNISSFIFEKLNVQIGKKPILYDIRGVNGSKSFRRNNYWITGNCDPLGLFFNIDLDEYQIDFFWAKYSDMSKQTGTGNSQDRDMYAIVIDYAPKDSLLFRGHIYHLNYIFDLNFTTIALGADMLLLDDKLELYTELGYQFGRIFGGVDISAIGGYAGFEYTFNHKWKPYISAEFFYLGGSHGDKAQWFDMYGDFARTLIFDGDHQDQKFVEEVFMSSGFEQGGYSRLSMYLGCKDLPNSLFGDLALHYIWDTNDTNSGDDIGYEIDATLSWQYSSDLLFEFGAGVFVANENYAGFKDPDPAWLLVWNTTIKF